jgi:hypothetical protein
MNVKNFGNIANDHKIQQSKHVPQSIAQEYKIQQSENRTNTNP